MILFAPTFQDLIVRLRELFALLTENGVNLNLSKCTSGLKEVTFLGHRISAERSQPDPNNVEAVTKMKAPTNVREVSRFLGMCGSYLKHVPSFAKVAIPLINLTKKHHTFTWAEDCQKSYEQLKNCLVNASILVKAQPDQQFVLTTDYSDSHVGGILSQSQGNGTNRPLEYFFKKLNPCE